MKTIPLSYQKNVRDLGGLRGEKNRPIKEGRLFRGGSLHRVSEEDIESLNQLHLTDIIDFRGSEEFIHKPDYRLEGVEYYNIPLINTKIKKDDRKKDDGNLLWFIDKGNNGHKYLQGQYQELIIDPRCQESFRLTFNILLIDENRRVYFHCSQGKDRAGVMAYLLETALGVSEVDKMNDYLYSNIAMEEKVNNLLESIKRKPFFNEEYHQSLLDVFSAKEEYLLEAIQAMEEMSGSPLNYIKDVLGVDIDKLRKIYLK